MAPGWTSEEKAKDRRPAEATTKTSGSGVILLPKWGPQAAMGPGGEGLSG